MVIGFGAWMAAAAAGDGAAAVHDPAHPVAVGVRMGAWTGPYTSPALGGHLKLKPHRSFGVEAFADHTLRIADGIARHDHVIGFSLYTPVLVGSRRAYLSPTAGACVDFRVDTPVAERRPSSADILFGVHAGGMAEVAVGDGFSLEATADAFVYWGNQLDTAAWATTASPGLHPTAVAQLLASVNYAF